MERLARARDLGTRPRARNRGQRRADYDSRGSDRGMRDGWFAVCGDLGRWPCGRRSSWVSAVSLIVLSRRVRSLGRHVCESLRRSRTPRRESQLGQRGPQRGARGHGVVGEVVYPNTVPPFSSGGLVASVPSAEDYRLRLAGLRAHNRWLADWCDQLPGRRAGIGQILLNDVDDAVADVAWIADHGLRGGLLLPGMPPGCGIDPLHSPGYDPVWRACEERGVVLNVHGGSGSPDPGCSPRRPPCSCSKRRSSRTGRCGRSSPRGCSIDSPVSRWCSWKLVRVGCRTPCGPWTPSRQSKSRATSV